MNAPVDGDALAIVQVLPRYQAALYRAVLSGCCWNAIDPLKQAIDPIIEADPKGLLTGRH